MSQSMVTPNMDEFLAEVMNLPAAVRERVLKGAVASGAKVVKNEAILRAPVWTGPVQGGHPPPGTLKRAIYSTRAVNKCTPTTEVWIVDVRAGKRTITKGKRKGEVTDDQNAYYASWVEYGHYTRTPGTTKRQHREARRAGVAISMGAKWVPPKPYMRPSIEAKKDAAFDAMAAYIVKNLPAAVQAMKYIKVTG